MKSNSTDQWYDLSLKIHRSYGGKIEVIPKVPIKSLQDFSILYTPGVAQPSRVISRDPDQSFLLTSRWNMIAVVTDGTRVLGLGNIGPEASYPVMEGKALLFKYLGGVDAIPLPIRARDPDTFIDIVKSIEPAFGGINLEDIESPKCFYILEKLRESLEIPIWHDDQQGTATAILAGLINALKLVGKKLSEVVIAFIGAGASNIATANLVIKAGAKPGNIIMVDSKGILYHEREDIDSLMFSNRWKYDLAIKTNSEQRKGGIPEALKGADVVIAASRPGPGIIKKEWIRAMNDDPIVFALANPVPEIWPWEAKEAGARIIATGRSDFPNQINNSLVFPSVFRGVLSVRAKTISDDMALEAAYSLARFAENKGLREDYIVPRMDELDTYIQVAVDVALKAIDTGVARVKKSKKDLYDEVVRLIRSAKSKLDALMNMGLIQ